MMMQPPNPDAAFLGDVRKSGVVLAVVLVTFSFGPAPRAVRAATLEVGPEKRFQRIEEASAGARPGDVILIYPQQDGQPYRKTAVFVRQKQLVFRGVPSPGSRWVKISGQGFDYSGRGSTPRAIFQFNPGSDHCLLEGLELSDAHNQSHNGSGVRINGANHVTIRNCSIHDNDMGIMSNGDGSLHAAVDQRIEHCEIRHNGDHRKPGFNHNLYLGGTSVTLSFCDVHHSLTGHNVKSRAHHTRVEFCYVHDSANREFDLVDAAETARPESHAVLLGNVIVKDPLGRGNRTVIHFGQDGGGEHDGAVHLSFNTVVTPFIAPVVDLSAAKAKAHLVGNLVADGGVRQAGQKVADFRGGATARNVTGLHNWFSGDFGGAGDTGLDTTTNVFRRAKGPLFIDAAQHNYHLTPEAAAAAAVPLSARQIALPTPPGRPETEVEQPLAWQYRHPLGKEKRPPEAKPVMGAYAADGE